MQALAELWTFVTAWYNLPFSLALLIFLALSALQFIGLEQDHDADAELQVDLDHDIDLDSDLDLDHDLDVDHDADLDPDLDHDVGADVTDLSTWVGVLQFLGVGQAPLTMILLLLVGSFGLLGWVMNMLVLRVFPAYPNWALAAILVAALCLSVWVTSRAARFIGRVLPAFTSTATSTARLVSRPGRVISAQVDQSYGQVKLRDSGGTLITVFVKVDPGKPPIPRDTEVYLVGYDPDKKVFTVVPSEE